MDLSDNPVLWQRTPAAIAQEISPNSVMKEAIAQAITAERTAARPYVQSCTDARWADDDTQQPRIHSITLNGVDVTPVCVGFNTTAGWAELLITGGVHPDGRPKMIVNRARSSVLTVRVSGDVQVIMTGAVAQARQHVAHEAVS